MGSSRTQNGVWVAYSGGLDSSVLLHALVQLRQTKIFTVRAVHIHHGLNPQADAWQRHCIEYCQKLQVDCVTHRLDLSASKKNIEARARTLRYHYWAALLNEQDILCTAHHQDDQAETVLLQLMRGASSKGLSAMPWTSVLGRGKLWRPLLGLSRDELRQYAVYYSIPWIEDDSNGDVRFARNFVRGEIMPALKMRWPAVAQTLARSARHCAETEELLHQYAAQLLKTCLGKNNSLKIASLQALLSAQQKLVIRHWLRAQGFFTPRELQLNNLLDTFFNAASDRNPSMTWGDTELHRYRGHIFAMHTLSTHALDQVIPWTDMTQPLSITSLNLRLSVAASMSSGVMMAPGQYSEIRFQHPQGSLKKYFQRWSVPPWKRGRIPLLYINNTLAAVIGYKIFKPFQVKDGEVGIEIKSNALI